MATTRPARLPGFLLGIYISWLFIGSWVPYQPPADWEFAPQSVAEVLTFGWGGLDGRNIVEHVATFLPLGLLIYWFRSCRWGVRAIPSTVLLVCVLALILEIGQNMVPARHARWWDAAVHGLAGAGGIVLGRWMGAALSAIEGWYVRRERTIAVVSLAIGQAAIVGLFVRCFSGATLSNWDCSFPLVIGNEATGDRPWRGRVAKVSIYDQALSADDLARLAAEFTDPISRLVDADARRRNSDNTAPIAQFELGTDLIDAGVFPAKDDQAGRICQAIRRTGRFSIELWAWPMNLTQGGPARMVSMSADSKRRNVTVSQNGDRVDLRIRTPRTGLNGMSILLQSRPHALSSGWQHVAMVYDRGVVRLFVNGEESMVAVHLHSLAITIFRRAWFGSTVLAAGVLFVPLSLLAIASGRSGPLSSLPRRLFTVVTVPLVAHVTAASWYGMGADVVLVVAIPAVAVVTLLAMKRMGRANSGG